MTAETLKPFITPASAVDNFPAMQSGGSHSQRKIKLIAIGLSVAALSLAVILLGLSIWQTTRVKHLETELNNLKRVVDNLQQRLGINYLDDLDDFEREYKKALIDDPNKLDESDLIEDDQEDIVSWNGDDDEDDDLDSNGEYIDYEDLIRKFSVRDESNDTISEEGNSKTANVKIVDADADDETDADADLDIDGDGSNASNDDNVFDDFKSYSDSKKKRERKSRSIAEARNDVQTFDIAQQSTQNKTQLEQQQEKSGKDDSDHASHFARRKTLSTHSRHIVADQMQPRRPATPLRLRTARRRNLPVLRSAKSSALYAAPATSTAAAHFHLNRKLPHHISPIRPDGYHGDMYIGHATASNDNSWQQHFTIENGVLTVHAPGLYYVYAQICYNNTHDQNGFIIFHGHKPFLQCLNTVPTNMPQKVHTCHTSGLIQLQEQDSIHLRDIHSDRNVMLRDANNRSYFGLIKV